MVLPHVEPVLRLDALHGHPGADDLGEPVQVDRVHLEPVLDLAAHLLRPRLGAEDPDPERGRPRVDALPLELVEDREHVRRRDHDHVRPEVDEQAHLTLRHAAGDRDDEAAEAFGAVVRAQTAGEEPVPVRDVHAVAGPRAARADRACHHLRPRLDVPGRVADHGRAPGRPARGVDSRDALERDREEAERIRPAEVVLRREGEAREVGERAAVVRVGARVVEARTDVGDVLVGVTERPPEPFQLERGELVGRGALDRIEALAVGGQVGEPHRGERRAVPRPFPGAVNRLEPLSHP